MALIDQSSHHHACQTACQERCTEGAADLDPVRTEVEFDVELCFKPNSRNDIMAEGRRMARAWKL